MAFRGVFSLFLVGVFLLTGDLVQRTIIVPLVWFFPSSRGRVLRRWIRWLSAISVWLPRHVGGADIDIRARIAADPGTLILMNNQSLLVIPVAYEVKKGGYAFAVTRARYGRKIPLVSPLLRFDNHPLVDPGRGGAAQLERLRKVAATTTHPMLIYPEGSRTRDGEIRPFRTAGLEAILGARRWNVHVVVVDGFWRCAKLVDYIHNISSVRARIESTGPFPSPGPEEDVAAFIVRMRDLMCDKLHEMREAPASRVADQE